MDDIAVEIINYTNFHIHKRISNLGNGEGVFKPGFMGNLTQVDIRNPGFFLTD